MSTEAETPLEVAPERASGKQGRRALSDRAIINLFIWPTLALLIAINVFPLFYSLFGEFQWPGRERVRGRGT